VRAACRIADGSKEILSLGNIDIARDWGWAPDFVKAMWAILQNDTAEDFIISTGQTCTLKEFTATVFKYCGLNWENHVKHDQNLLRPSDILVSKGNPEKASIKLGWESQYFMDDVACMLVKYNKNY